MKKFLTILSVVVFVFLISCGGGASDGNGVTDADGNADEDASDGDNVGIVFADEALLKCVENHTSTGGTEKEELEKIATLRCTGMEIMDISGIEKLKNLQILSLFENGIEDISALAELTNLKEIELGVNQIADASALSSLTLVEKLSLSFNKIATIDAIKGLTSLTWLNLDANKIEDISPLLELATLKWLTVEQNPVDNWDIAADFTKKGVEIYYSYTNYFGVTHRSLPVRKEGIAVLRPAIYPLVTASSGVVFVYSNREGNTLLATKTFPGEITLDAGEVLYRDGKKVSKIGVMQDGKIAICGDKSCTLSYGVKYPSAQDFGSEPVVTVRLVFASEDTQEKNTQGDEFYNNLDSFTMSSPNQLDGGTCLFMANTGAMEVLRNQKLKLIEAYKEHDSDNDLSERFLINASDYVPKTDVQYHITDLIKTFDYFRGGMLNKDYRFTAGYIVDENGSKRAATSPDEEGAYLSCSYNWLDGLPKGFEDLVTETPEVDRTIIFLDPDLDESSIWNLAIMDDSVIDRVKHEIRTKNTPVVVVYNHFLYWHAVIIVGYDDNDTSEGNCPMVRASIKHFEDEDAPSYAKKLEDYIEEEGGCVDKGVFYVRDSIYEGDKSPENLYKYNDDINFYEPYSERIVTHSYDWLKYLGNHAYSVHRK